jgi:hypothetical protein
MYSAYFDESGHPDSSSHLVVAGCIAEVEQWVHFEREWLSALNPFETKVFHATDFEQRKPPFDRLDDIQRRDFLRLLVSIIGRRVEKQIAHAIPMDVYRALNTKYVFAECYGFPYPAAARMCMAGVAEWAAHHSVKDEIVYCFENGAKHRGQIEWAAERDKLPIPLFPTKEQAVALQAGDFISWLQNRILAGSADESHMDLMGRLEAHACDWSKLNFLTGEAIVKWANIPLRDPELRYKCKIIRSKGRRRALVHYWRKDKHEPKIERKTLVLPEALPPFFGTSLEEIAESPIMSSLAKVGASKE